MKYIIFIFSILFINSISFSKSYLVENGNLNDLQNFLNIADNHDTINIKGGIFKLSGIVITKPIFIKGESYPVLDANNSKTDLITIQSDSVVLDGIKLINVQKSYTSDNAAIKIVEAKGVEIRNIKTENCFFGLYLKEASYSVIKDNIIIGNKQNETSSGNGIHLWKSNHITISNNTIFHHRDGIYFEFVKNSKIYSNISKRNLRYGLHFMFSDSCTYKYNLFWKNGAGVAVMYSKSVLMNKNIFKENWGSASYGLLLKDIKDSRIEHNKFINNTIGILAEGSNRVIIEYNNFERNGWGMKMLGNCVDNIVKNNNFISNSFDLSTNSMESYNIYERNYWSNYKGYDLNKDGIGDVPYYPVSLFSVIVQTSSPAMILMHSLFINVLEISEKIFPSLIPKKVIDLKPRMSKVND